MKNEFTVIGFDADDTLWINQPNYDEAEKNYYRFLSDYCPPQKISEKLYKIELQNLELYGYGAKSFTLSLIETALRISKNKVPQNIIEKIIKLGKELINRPVILLEGVQGVLENLFENGQKLIIATKGDLLDQKRKLKNSNIGKYFHHIEIMSNKNESDYQNLLSHLDIKPMDFLMIGNSLKSDILPVLKISGYGIHIPYHTTWQHEQSLKSVTHDNFIEITHISELTNIFKT